MICKGLGLIRYVEYEINYIYVQYCLFLVCVMVKCCCGVYGAMVRGMVKYMKVGRKPRWCMF